jgi:hypothetical protein
MEPVTVGIRLNLLALQEKTMDSSPTDPPPTKGSEGLKRPWTVPTVTRVPIVSRTQNRPGFRFDAGGFDDSGS